MGCASSKLSGQVTEPAVNPTERGPDPMLGGQRGQRQPQPQQKQIPQHQQQHQQQQQQQQQQRVEDSQRSLRVDESSDDDDDVRIKVNSSGVIDHSSSMGASISSTDALGDSLPKNDHRNGGSRSPLPQCEDVGDEISASSHSAAVPPPPRPSQPDAPSSGDGDPSPDEADADADPRWEHLFAALSPRLLDPEDLPSALDAAMSAAINKLSPVEVSFIRRRARDSIRATVGGEGGNGEGGGGGIASASSGAAGLVGLVSAAVVPGGGGTPSPAGKRSSLSKKMGRLVGYASISEKSNSVKDGADGSVHGWPSRHPALDESADRPRTSKSVFRKEGLMDVTSFRRAFEGGERCLRGLRAGARAELLEPPSAANNAQPRRNSKLAGVSAHEDPAPAANKSVGQLHAEALERVDVYGSAFLLLLYMSESRWDYVTDIAKLSAWKAGLTMDVNKLALRKEEEEEHGEAQKTNGKNGRKSKNGRAKIPPPPGPPSFAPPSETYGEPGLTIAEPHGIRLTSLCFLVATALRGTRRQRLGLLFHLLLPPGELNGVLASHPAGGLPTWILEAGDDVVLTYGSLSYYYNYDGVLLPPSAEEERDECPPAAARRRGRERLCVDTNSTVEVLSALLARSIGVEDSRGSALHRLSGALSSVSEHLENEDADAEDSPSSMKCLEVSEMLLQASQDGGATFSAPCREGTVQIEKFVKLSTSLADSSFLSNDSVRLEWSMHDFVEWANVALNDVVLDNIMSSLFGAGVLPSAKMEHRLVTQRWIDWNVQRSDDAPSSTASDGGEGHTAPPSGLRRMFTSTESGCADEGTAGVGGFNTVWGGIGGIDGKGGLGSGVLYCIDRHWWDDWTAFTGWELGECRQSRSPSSLKRPRELSTERLIDRSPDAPYVPGSRGSYEIMRQDLVHGEDFVLVPPGVWNVLYEMYGGGPPLPRMVVPNNETDEAHMNGGGDGRVTLVENESVEVVSPESQGPEGVSVRRYLREIPASVRVVTHPWILHCQICDPQQPYRRGDAGPMSIRIMAMPDQPLWRLFAEVVVRLPIIHSKARDSQGEGRARLWRFEVVNGKVPPPTSRYGPWALLCKNRHAEIPISTPSYEKYEERWDSYADRHSVESIGLVDGMRLMFEYAVANKDGSFTWPREAAAKATTARRIADEDAIFRLLLRGREVNGEPLKAPIMRKAVDAMDSSGRWYQAIIVNAEHVSKDSDIDNKADPDDGNEATSNSAKSDHPAFRENSHVCVHFVGQPDTHQEWIEVTSDRIAARGRMTSSSVRNLDREQDGEEEKTPSEPKSRLAAGINKKKDTSEANSSDPNSNAVCLFPSYGSCGLINLGNTCYANSGWQCMSYLPLIRSYLLSGQFKINGDMNRDNPLGTGGRILEEFSELLHFMWSGKYGARAPQKFRSFLAKCRSQYTGADQQDAQELLNDMFDMLHEDGNRVRKKPYVEPLEDKFIEKTDISRVGQEAWRRFLRRNRSAITDLSMGQVYNRVTCPVCNHSSKNFDPFNMLSLPFPTVAEVIFQCTVVRRASVLNCPNTLAFVRRHNQQKEKPKSSKVNISPPSKDLIFEEYLIPMSRLADLGDLKMKLQNLTGIAAKDLRVCKREDIESNASDAANSYQQIYTKVSVLPDKEGPCVKLLQQESLDDVSSPTIARIVAFESTLVYRPIEIPERRQSVGSRAEATDDDASTTADEMSTDSSIHKATTVYQSKTEEIMVQEYLKVYGDGKECVVFDTNPTPLAKVISRSLWPKSAKDFTLGLRVDAIDHRNHWFPGSVIEIVVGSTEGNSEEDGENTSEPTTRVKIHFDNFSAKWDEIYSIDHFNKGRVCPLYSHATPRPKPTEFIVHHRGLDRKTKKCYLFGQSFYIQCRNEWSTARAGAHILAQASRFLEVSHFKASENGKKMDSIDRKIAEKERHEARNVISRVIEALIKSDQKYVESAIDAGKRLKDDGDRPPFDVSVMSQILSKKLGEVLPLLPFDVRVTAANSPLGTNNDESPFPFSLVRTIGNYMNARHSLVLHWREKSEGHHNLSNKKHSDRAGHFLYSPPFIATHKQSLELLNANQKKQAGNVSIKRHPSSSHGGLHIGVCLTEFCKEQQLDATAGWRCPVCKVEREGKQSMTLWNLPDLLTFHLKRFNASSRWREKITTRVDFPLTGLNVREWCDAESSLCAGSNDEAFIYDLVGVVNHYGGMTGGHYVATCKATACSPDGDEEVSYNFNGAGVTEIGAAEEVAAAAASSSGGWRARGPGLGRSKEKESLSNADAAAKAVAESAEPLWLQFDDDLVEPLPPRNVVSETAYVLFYRRRRMRPANIAKYSYLG